MDTATPAQNTVPAAVIAALMEGSNDAVVVYDGAFRFLYLNAEAERLLALPREQVYGKVLWDLFPDRALPFREPLQRAMRERVPVVFEAGAERNVEGRCIPLAEYSADAPQGAALAVFFQDVTDRYLAARAREEAEAARERMAFLAEASAILSSSLEYQATLESMAHIVVPRLCDWCAVQMPSADGTRIEQVAVAHVDPAKVAWARDLNRRYPTRSDEPRGIAEVIRTGEAIFMPEVPEAVLVAGAKDEEHLRIILGLGFRSAIAVPLTARGATLGALLMVTTDESGRRLTADDLTFAEELANRAAVAIDNARLFHKARQEEERFRALIEASSQMVWRTGPDGLIVDMPEWRAYTGQTEAEVRGYGWTQAIHPEDRAHVEHIWLTAFHGRTLYECEYRVRGRDGIYRWFFARGIPLLDADGTLREFIGTWASIDAQRRAEAEREERHRATQERAKREALLNRLSAAIRGLIEPDEILTVAVRELAEAMATDRCYFAEYEVPRDWASVSIEWRRPDLPSLIGSYRLSSLDIDAVTMFRGAEGLLVAEDLSVGDNAFSLKAAALLADLGLRAIMGVALLENGLPVAALMVAMAEQARPWTPDEIELVRAVAALIRSAMEDARLRKREHNIAEQLQTALQPSIPGRLPGVEIDAHYQPALAEARIGGDFYDVFPIEQGCYALVVADLSGKGLAAAAQVATVRHMLRALLYQQRTTVAQAVTQLNTMLEEHDLLEGFATLFVGAYDVHQRTITYASCGQEPGLILRRATDTVEEMRATGPVLGSFPGATFEERTVALASGDTFALFTDGLTEAGPNRKELLGVSGVTNVFRTSAMQALTPQDTIARMIAAVQSLATSGGIRDDVCLLVGCVE